MAEGGGVKGSILKLSLAEGVLGMLRSLTDSTAVVDQVNLCKPSHGRFSFWRTGCNYKALIRTLADPNVVGSSSRSDWSECFLSFKSRLARKCELKGWAAGTPKRQQLEEPEYWRDSHLSGTMSALEELIEHLECNQEPLRLVQLLASLQENHDFIGGRIGEKLDRLMMKVNEHVPPVPVMLPEGHVKGCTLEKLNNAVLRWIEFLAYSLDVFTPHELTLKVKILSYIATLFQLGVFRHRRVRYSDRILAALDDLPEALERKMIANNLDLRMHLLLCQKRVVRLLRANGPPISGGLPTYDWVIEPRKNRGRQQHQFNSRPVHYPARLLEAKPPAELALLEQMGLAAALRAADSCTTQQEQTPECLQLTKQHSRCLLSDTATTHITDAAYSPEEDWFSGFPQTASAAALSWHARVSKSCEEPRRVYRAPASAGGFSEPSKEAFHSPLRSSMKNERFDSPCVQAPLHASPTRKSVRFHLEPERLTLSVPSSSLSSAEGR